MLVKDVVSQFLDWKLANHSENTHRFYAGRLAFLLSRLGDFHFEQLTAFRIEHYFVSVNNWPIDDANAERAGKPKAADTVRSNILAFEKLQEFALRGGFITELFEVPEKPEGVRRTRLPTPDEVEAIKAVSNKQFRLAYEALRVCGKSPYLLAKAKVSDWDKKKKTIVIWSGARAGTTSKKREIHVGKRLEELILESLGDRTEGFLFLTPTGLAWTTASLSAAFRRARNQLELSKEIVLFSARHEHALKMIRAGLDYQDRMDS